MLCVDRSRIEAFRGVLLSWAEGELRSFPWRDPSRSLYEVFVAEFLLTQTPAENVADLYPKFLQQYPSLAAIRATDEATLQDVLEPVGFQRQRARWLSEIGATVDALPRTFEGLTELPGVGTYVADATLCFALGDARPIVDRNVDRVYRRVFGDDWPADGSDERRRVAAEILPEERARQYNMALLDFGAAVCQKREPRCGVCPANQLCQYYTTEVSDET